jgi:hypothetical protein
MERESRYWIAAHPGCKDEQLFAQGTQQVWDWAKRSDSSRWLSDGERRYGKQLRSLASVFLPLKDYPRDYEHRKVWREGLEAAMKIKGSQGQRRVEWVKVEHPFTAISSIYEVHTNDQGASVRKWCNRW